MFLTIFEYLRVVWFLNFWLKLSPGFLIPGFLIGGDGVYISDLGMVQDLVPPLMMRFLWFAFFCF